MELLLDRDIRTTKSTTGKLYVNNVFECFILEDVDRGLKNSMPPSEISDRKIKYETCIPEGRYEVRITYSPHFDKNMPLVMNVPGYDGIRIHPGNTNANTAGCLLPGVARNVDTVINSKAAFDQLFSKLQAAQDREEKVFITIRA